MKMVNGFLVFIAAVFMMVGLFAADVRAEKKVGVLLWTEEARYSESQKGIIDQMKKDGLGEPEVKFITEHAAGNKAKAVEIANKFSAAKVDMIIALGTTAAAIAAKDIKDIPIIFSMVYDPVEAKIAQDWKSSGNNTTGASNKVQLSKVVSSMKQIAPVKRLGVLYTPGEKNSEIQLREIQAEQGNVQIKVIPIPLARKEDVSRFLSDAMSSVDALYLAGSSIVGDGVSMIVDMANKAKIITATHLEDYVEKGALLGVAADPYALGQLAGTKAVKVLKGAKPSTVPIETLKNPDVMLNMKTAKASQIQIPEAFMKTVTKKIQ